MVRDAMRILKALDHIDQGLAGRVNSLLHVTSNSVLYMPPLLRLDHEDPRADLLARLIAAADKHERPVAAFLDALRLLTEVADGLLAALDDSSAPSELGVRLEGR